MQAGVLKAAPIAALLGTLSVKEVVTYGSVALALGGVLAVGGLLQAMNAWRSRAEARADQVDEMKDKIETLEQKLADGETERHEQAKKIAALDAELRARPDIRESHQQILAAIQQAAGAMQAVAEASKAASEASNPHR